MRTVSYGWVRPDGKEAGFVLSETKTSNSQREDRKAGAKLKGGRKDLQCLLKKNREHQMETSVEGKRKEKKIKGGVCFRVRVTTMAVPFLDKLHAASMLLFVAGSAVQYSTQWGHAANKGSVLDVEVDVCGERLGLGNIQVWMFGGGWETSGGWPTNQWPADGPGLTGPLVWKLAGVMTRSTFKVQGCLGL